MWSGQTRPLLMEAPYPLTPDTTAASLRGSERQRQRSRDLEDGPGKSTALFVRAQTYLKLLNILIIASFVQVS